MICYRDKSFCEKSKTCDNTECADRLSPEEYRRAQHWWNRQLSIEEWTGAPISFSPYQSNTCNFKEVAPQWGNKNATTSTDK